MSKRPRLSQTLIPILFSVGGALLGPTQSDANEAQYHICNVGINLGNAASREFFFGRAFDGEPPAIQVGHIADNVANAAAEATAAENLFLSPEPPNRPPNSALDSFLRSLDSYMDRRSSMNYTQRAYRLGSLAGNYRTSIQWTFASNREPEFNPRPNCDTAIFLACYHFGYATTAAAVGDTVAESSSVGEMRSAIYDGLRNAGDMVQISETKEVCCSMGSKSDWAPILGIDRQAPHSTFASMMAVIQGIGRRAHLSPGACGSHPGGIEGRWEGCDGRVVDFRREGDWINGYYVALGDLGRFGFELGELGYRLQPSNAEGYRGEVKWRYTDGRVEWRPTTLAVDESRLTDSGGDRCSRTWTRR